jgi:hypothetical protein
LGVLDRLTIDQIPVATETQINVSIRSDIPA